MMIPRKINFDLIRYYVIFAATLYLSIFSDHLISLVLYLWLLSFLLSFKVRNNWIHIIHINTYKRKLSSVSLIQNLRQALVTKSKGSFFQFRSKVLLNLTRFSERNSIISSLVWEVLMDLDQFTWSFCFYKITQMELAAKRPAGR